MLTAAACLARIDRPSRSCSSSAMKASALIRKPPPIQITAKTTWNVLNAPYQSLGEAMMNSTATRTNTTPIT